MRRPTRSSGKSRTTNMAAASTRSCIGSVDYHGTTITALSSCGQNQRKDQYGPFTPGFVEVPHCLEYRSQFGDSADYGVQAARAIEDVILREGPDTIGGIVLEPITAGGGVITPPEGYWENRAGDLPEIRRTAPYR